MQQNVVLTDPHRRGSILTLEFSTSCNKIQNQINITEERQISIVEHLRDCVGNLSVV